MKNRVTDDEIVKVCNESLSMAIAASVLKIHFNTLKGRAIKLKCYKPNTPGKGIKKGKQTKIKTEDILKGKYPSYQTYKLKIRLLTEGYKENKCEECDIENWNGKKLNIELDHIDGDRTNHLLKNLKMLCPNCHSQTETFRAKNIK